MMNGQLCQNTDLQGEVHCPASPGGTVTIELYRLNEGTTPVIIEWYNEGGEKEEFELPAGRKIQ